MSQVVRKMMKPIAKEPPMSTLQWQRLFEYRRRLSTCAILLTVVALATFELVSVSGENSSRISNVSSIHRGNQAFEPKDEKDSASKWAHLKKTTQANFQSGLSDIVLPVEIDDYEAKFLANEAPHSIGKYQMETIGDTDIETSQWQQSAEDKGLIRYINYVHPINVPMAPPRAEATKQQRLTKYGTHGILLETLTVVNGIPKTDCFVVEDRILLEPTNDGGVVISAWFVIRFTKKTMFKSIIERTTASEFQQWFLKYGEMVKQAVGVMTADDRQLSAYQNNKNYLISPGGASLDQSVKIYRFPSDSRLPWLSFVTGKSY